MIAFAFNATAATFINMIIFALGVLMFRGIKFPPGNFEYFLLVMLVASVLNAVVTPYVLRIKVPRLFFIPIAAATGINFGLMKFFENFAEGSLVIESTLWLVAFSAFVGIITGFLSRIAMNLSLVKGLPGG